MLKQLFGYLVLAVPAFAQTDRLTSGVPATFTLNPVSAPTAFGNWPISVPNGASQLKLELEIATPGVSLTLYTSAAQPVLVMSQGGGIYTVTTRFGYSATASSTSPAVITITPSSSPFALRAPETYYVAAVTSTLSVTARVTVTATVSTPAPEVTSVSAATFARGAALAAESIASAFGQGLAATTEVATAVPLPTSLAGTTVKVKDSLGVERLAPLFFVSPGQVNYLIPEGTRAGPATITVTSREQAVGSGAVQIEAVAPGLFTANTSGRGVAAALALRVRGDGSQTNQPVFQCGATAGSCVPAPIDLGPESDQVFLLLFGTGIRGRSGLSAISATIGGEAAEVLAAGPQGQFVGLDQINLRVPRTLNGRGEVNVVLTVDGKPANTVTINIARTQTNTPPVISNATGVCCAIDTTGRIIIGAVRFDFVDPDADIIYTGREAGSAKLRLTVPAVGTLRGCSLTLTGPTLHSPGRTSGTVNFRVETPRGQLASGNFPLSITLIDAAGNEGNTVTTQVDMWNCP